RGESQDWRGQRHQVRPWRAVHLYASLQASPQAGADRNRVLLFSLRLVFRGCDAADAVDAKTHRQSTSCAPQPAMSSPGCDDDIGIAMLGMDARQRPSGGHETDGGVRRAPDVTAYRPRSVFEHDVDDGDAPFLHRGPALTKRRRQIRGILDAYA